MGMHVVSTKRFRFGPALLLFMVNTCLWMALSWMPGIKTRSSFRLYTENDDWRDFRAKLVLSQNTAATWAHDCGMIEEGSILLGSLEQDFGYGIRQQYFHKSVLLVLYHSSNFTKAIILNRPTNLVLSVDFDCVYPDNNKSSTRLWFGGDVQWISHSDEKAQFTCLHSLSNNQAATSVSHKIIKNLYWSTLSHVKQLVNHGDANMNDFYFICGYAGWSAGQLQDELDRGAWTMVATDSQTLLKQLRQNLTPLDAGIEMWNTLMSMTRGNDISMNEPSFDDKMLLEWTQQHLVLSDLTSERQVLALLSQASIQQKISVGTLLRGSSLTCSPFLLDHQEFHKSIVLITRVEKLYTVGLLLNHPLPCTEHEVIERYGGRFGIKGKKPTVWLHLFHGASIGQPLTNKIWQCSNEEVFEAIQQGIASPRDFMKIQGFTVWPKATGISLVEEINRGNFEVVPSSKTSDVWDALISQQALSTRTLDTNLMYAKMAWDAAGSSSGNPISLFPNALFESNNTIATLCDEALRCWVATVLLGDPSVRHSDSLFG